LYAGREREIALFTLVRKKKSKNNGRKGRESMSYHLCQRKRSMEKIYNSRTQREKPLAYRHQGKNESGEKGHFGISWKRRKTDEEIRGCGGKREWYHEHFLLKRRKGRKERQCGFCPTSGTEVGEGTNLC